MRHPVLASRLACLSVCALVTAPLAGADGAGNRADVAVHSDRSAAAVCQVLVLVNALILLELEDTLGLVAYDASEPAEIVLPSPSGEPTARADCSVVVDSLAIDVTRPDGLATGGAYVSGPPGLASTNGTKPGLSWRVNVTGAQSEARVCQFVVIVSSIIMGGGAFGLSPGHAPIVEKVQTGEGAGPGGSAGCDADVRHVTINGATVAPRSAVIA